MVDLPTVGLFVGGAGYATLSLEDTIDVTGSNPILVKDIRPVRD